MDQEAKGWVGFEQYITREEKRRRQEEGKKEIIVIEPMDTKHTLKRKRNNGCCEFEGCMAKENVEWHHRLSLYPQNSAAKG